MLYVNPLDTITARAGNFGAEQREKTAFKELEQLLAYTLLQEMRKTVPENELFGTSQQKQTFEAFLDEALAKSWAESGQLGIAGQMEAQLAAQNAAKTNRQSNLL